LPGYERGDQAGSHGRDELHCGDSVKQREASELRLAKGVASIDFRDWKT
jgi:hypothetical protein